MAQGSYSITIRASIPTGVGRLGEVMAVLGAAGGEVAGVDLVRGGRVATVRDITVYAGEEDAAGRLRAALEALDGVEVEWVSDRVFLSHVGGKIGMRNRAPLQTRDDLSMAYTPGVARVCMAIHDDFDKAWDYTIKGNSVMVVGDGSSVVGQGDVGALAALSAIEAKCMFLRELAGVDAFPLPLDERDPGRIADVVELSSSVFAGIQLTDIAAPRCFTVRRELAERLDIPVFADDQGGTAVALLAALANGLTLAGKDLGASRVVVAGLGPGGMATVRLLIAAGAGDVIACDTRGAVTVGRGDSSGELAWVAENTNAEGLTGTVDQVIAGADAFIGLAAPGLLTADDVRAMAPDPVVLALAMPEPEIGPTAARGIVAAYASGRPDVPNQINSSLAFPGIWRGLLDCRATEVNAEILLAAAGAIAAVCVDDAPLAPDSIVPSVFHPRLVSRVAAAVRSAAEASGVARVTTATTG